MTSVTTSRRMWDKQGRYFLCNFRGMERRPGLHDCGQSYGWARLSQEVLLGELKRLTSK